MQSLQNLVWHAVDYAGLFPPAGLPMDKVVANYSDYLSRATRPMLGRLVVPATRLEEFEASAMRLLSTEEADLPWKISALVPSVGEDFDAVEFVSACQTILDFNEAHRASEFPRFVVDSIEIKTKSPDHVSDTIDRLPTGFQSFLEIDLQSDWGEAITRIATHPCNKNVFAKIRTGGVVADQIPSIERVAGFIGECARNLVGFKATAGLHHPIRDEYRLTYEDNPPRGILHGFLNVFVATLVAFEHRVDDQVLEEILAESTSSNFDFDENQLGWRGFHFNKNRIADLRKKSILSFGSCSFDEPTEELMSLGFDGPFITPA